MKYYILLIVLMLSLSCTEELGRYRRSISCKFGSRGCKWSCRLRGYIYGDCDQDDQCHCKQKISASALLHYFSEKWSAKYPDLELVADIIEDVFTRAKNDSCMLNNKDDGKWRPLPLLLGVLYKVQKNVHHRHHHAEDYSDSMKNEELINTLAYFWNIIMAADESLRDGMESTETDDEVRELMEKNKNDYAFKLGINVEQIAWVWMSPMDRSKVHISDYIPEHVITVLHDQKTIILTILGTQVIPTPAPMDIMMDLLATSHPFLGGQAHSGLSYGALNIVDTAIPRIKSILDKHPDYQILILGYSLGGGLAQLMALDCKIGRCAGMLPSNVAITVIGFGSPPVYTSPVIPQLDNLILVTNNEDAMSGASLKNIHDVADQLCVVKHLNVRRRDMIKILFSSSDQNDDTDFELLDKFGEDHNHDTDEESLMHSIGSSIQNLSSNSPEPEMYHLASKLFALERRPDSNNDAIRVSIHEGLNETVTLTQELNILNRNMILDHLPEKYTDLFKGFGKLSDDIKIDYKQIEKLFRERETPKNRTKPKSKWKKFKTNVKEFFKGIG